MMLPHLSTAFARLLLPLLLLLCTMPAGAETVRIGLFVGNNIGMGADEPLVYAEKEAADFARLFGEMGGVSKDRSFVLAGTGAMRLKDTVATIEGQIREIEARGDTVLLLFYYSGHADFGGLHLNGEVVTMEWLRRWLESSEADTRVAFVDACESGTLARAKGGTPVDMIDVRVDDALTATGLAIITSSGPMSVARESAQFGGGVFSRALFTGLRGSADTNGDGAVSLTEAYDHAFEATVIGTASHGGSVQRPEYRTDMRGVGDVVLTRIARNAAGLVLPEELEGVYSLVSVATGQVIVRVDKKPGEVRRVTLSPGRYIVRKVRTTDVLVAELNLVWGGDRWVDDAQMTVVPLGDPLARGASAPLGALTLSPRFVGSSAMAAKSPLTGGIELMSKVRLAPNTALVGGVGYDTGVRWTWTSRLASGVGRASIGVLHERRLNRVDFQYGAGVQGLWLAQDVETTDWDEDRPIVSTWRFDQFTAGPYGQIGAHVPVGPVVGLEAGVRAVVYPVRVDDSTGYFVMGQPYAGLGFRFGGQKVGAVRKGPRPQ